MKVKWLRLGVLAAFAVAVSATLLDPPTVHYGAYGRGQIVAFPVLVSYWLGFLLIAGAAWKIIDLLWPSDRQDAKPEDTTNQATLVGVVLALVVLSGTQDAAIAGLAQTVGSVERSVSDMESSVDQLESAVQRFELNCR